MNESSKNVSTLVTTPTPLNYAAFKPMILNQMLGPQQTSNQNNLFFKKRLRTATMKSHNVDEGLHWLQVFSLSRSCL